MPIRQFFYFDAIECLPEDVFQSPTEAATTTTENKGSLRLPTKKSRYYSQEIVFGEDFQKALGGTIYFVVRKLSYLLITYKKICLRST